MIKYSLHTILQTKPDSNIFQNQVAVLNSLNIFPIYHKSFYQIYSIRRKNPKSMLLLTLLNTVQRYAWPVNFKSKYDFPHCLIFCLLHTEAGGSCIKFLHRNIAPFSATYWVLTLLFLVHFNDMISVLLSHHIPVICFWCLQHSLLFSSMLSSRILEGFLLSLSQVFVTKCLCIRMHEI